MPERACHRCKRRALHVSSIRRGRTLCGYCLSALREQDVNRSYGHREFAGKAIRPEWWPEHLAYLAARAASQLSLFPRWKER
jgi:hypothetical protein